MRIAFVSVLDPTNINNWSGTPYFMVEALKRRGHEVSWIGPLKGKYDSLRRILQRSLNITFPKYVDLTRTIAYAQSLSNSASGLMIGRDFDLILCPSSIVAAYLESDIPIVTWEDATFASMVNYYPGKWMNYSLRTIRSANLIQQRALSRAAFSLFSSEWAAQSARINYQVDDGRVVCVPFGANIEDPPISEEVLKAVGRRASAKECRILFVGVDWDRKGGDLVLETAERLRAQDLSVYVDIVGCNPPYVVPDYVIQHGFLSKSTVSGKQKLRQLFLNAHYLFVPSLAECYGLVFAEASAYGVLSLARDTGGIPSVVRNGENGWVLPVDGTASAYAQRIHSDMKDRDRYIRMALHARRLYEETFNWDSAVRNFEELMTPTMIAVQT